MTRAAILFVIVLLAGVPDVQAASVRIADGDSFSIGKQRYRLHGVDAPELHQDCKDAAGKWWPCGKRARDELRRLIGNNAVHCTERTRDRFGRAVAVCTAGGRDLGARRRQPRGRPSRTGFAGSGTLRADSGVPDGLGILV